MNIFDEASASGYKLIDARGNAWQAWSPASWIGQPTWSCDDSFCCLVGLPGTCCYSFAYPKVYFVDEEALAWLQANTPGDFPPVLDPSEFDPDASPSGDEPVNGDDDTTTLGLGDFSVPWWLIVGALLLLRKRKR